jgi:hypothetical protein
MPQDEPDWPLITRPAADRRIVARVAGVIVMGVGLSVLFIAAVRPGRNLDLEGVGLSLGLVLAGGFLRV